MTLLPPGMGGRTSLSDLIYLDVEASGLIEGFPIEVGWCSHDLRRGWTGLIRPTDNWLEHCVWSSESEDIHGLSKQALAQYGQDVGSVAERLNADLAGLDVLTDSPGTDGYWLRLLFTEADVPAAFPVLAPPPSNEPDMALWRQEKRLLDSDILLTAVAQRARINIAEAEQLAGALAAECGLVAHRALDDAIGHALRLGAAALLELATEHGNAASVVLRQDLVGRAVALRTGSAAARQRIEVSHPDAG